MGLHISKLSKKSIEKILNEYYELKVLNVRKIKKGTANIFKVNCKDDIYILKECPPKRTKESVYKEDSILRFLHSKKMKVPMFVKTKNNDIYIENCERLIVLQKCINGSTEENNCGNYERTIESANLLGKLVKNLDDYVGLSDEGIIQRWFSKSSLTKGLEDIEVIIKNIKDDNEYKNEILNDLEVKKKIAKYFIENFDFEIVNKMTIMNTHGDFSVQQFIYTDTGTYLIDFETAKRLPIMWEVIRSYSYIDADAKNGEFNIKNFIEYVNEFSKFVNLNEYDLKYAAYIYLIQIIGSVYGYKQYCEDYKKIDLLNFAFFRTKVCKYLYQNLELISGKLISQVRSKT